ncbi:MAG: thioredoxin domain-containing protein [Candidatus Bathyarchaeota archaeon]|nr:thioredoxin domain-containing protein [Candidatus Bathyarchaeota archaeon]
MQSSTQNSRKPNRLINEKSPYLLQHAYNPVDWYPWSPEAFEKAKAENKPIFLSIGYASCHWCHVMEKECFEDQEVAQLLNSAFVCIKVDREERPDLDAAYMAVCQAMGKNCGWPLSILMTPRLNPFFAASYIPKTSGRGGVGMLELVPQVTQIWKMRGNHLEFVGAEIKSRLEALEKRTPDNERGKETLDEAFESLARNFDSEHGGFGVAPKFPRPHSLLFLLRYWKSSGEKEAVGMVEKTLRQMRLGGIFDQLGFGFHRYSTDAVWLVPHFEKMLYDQALLALAYTEAYQATGASKFKVTAKETLEYVLRDLASAEGGFYSSQDADSEGEEGKFYVWTKQEVVDVVKPADADLATQLFGLSIEGNYFDAAVGQRNGRNILHLAVPLEEVAAAKGLTLDELIGRLGKIQRALFEARKSRVAPATDRKVLTDWNGLMIAALARAGYVFGESRFVEAAEKASDFLLTQMHDENGVLYHRNAGGERAVEGFLDDYACLAFGLIELYEATFKDSYLQAAVELIRKMNILFWDAKNGGFYFTSTKSESGMPKMKQIYDGAYPSGNSVALLNLLRLSSLANEPEFEERAHKLVKAFSLEAQSAPEAYTWLLAGVDFIVGPSQSVVLIGNLQEKDALEMVAALKKQYLPNMVVSLRDPAKAGAGYEMLDGKATAYVCVNQTCMPPTNKVEKMLELLGTK